MLHKHKESQLPRERGMYQRQTHESKALLIALATQHNVAALHAGAHLGIKPSTSTYIVRKYKLSSDGK